MSEILSLMSFKSMLGSQYWPIEVDIGLSMAGNVGYRGKSTVIGLTIVTILLSKRKELIITIYSVFLGVCRPLTRELHG